MEVSVKMEIFCYNDTEDVSESTFFTDLQSYFATDFGISAVHTVM